MRATGRSSRVLRRRRSVLNVELLETRTVPAAPSWTQQFAFDPVTPGAVLTAAPDLTLQSVSNPSGVWRDLVKGTIASGSADVDWYRLTLSTATTVSLNVFDAPGSSFAGVISLFNSDPDAMVQNLAGDGFSVYANDPYDPLGHRLVAQAEGTAIGGTALNWNLAAGTYYVAVSGAGNRFFHPFVADSGLSGSGGAYRLAIEADGLNLTGPTVLASNPLDNSVLTTSPLVLRVDLNQGLDPTTVLANQQSGNTVQLLYSADGTFANGGQSIFINFHVSPDAADPFSPGADELQLTPFAPLQAGYYQLVLHGIGHLGSSATDTTLHFRIASGEGDDVAASAHNLGNLALGSFIQRAGTIGDDPFYAFFDPSNADPASPSFTLPDNYAGADVDLYHFTITGPGSYILLAEAFAGRIGSPLDAGLSLFRLQGGQLVLVTANDNTLNDTTALGDNGYSGKPLFADPFLNAGLTAGDYYLAVSTGHNTPDAFRLGFVGVNGVFDPNLPHSGSSGPNNANSYTVGAYELNLRLALNPGAPHVVAVTPSSSLQPIATPTQIVVRFDQAMALQQEAYAAFQFNTAYAVGSVFVHGSDGVDYYPRIIGYDPTTFTATFQLLDALPNGVNQLHLSGPKGLTNLGGTPLAGNTPGGDYVVAFKVAGSTGGAGGSVSFVDQEPNNSLAQPQSLGILFPGMQQAGIPITRDFSHAPPGTVADTDDYYAFQVTQARQYTFILTGSGLPTGAQPDLTTLSGSPLFPVVNFFSAGVAATVFLQPGTYVVHLGTWTPSQAQSVTYRLYITIGQIGDNPTPLTVGAAPALSIRLVNGGPATTPVVVLPGGTPGIVPAGFTNANGLPSLVNLLPSSLLASGAVGGVTGGDGVITAGGGPVGPTLSASSARDMLELIVLTQLAGGDGGSAIDDDMTPLLSWVESYTAPVRESLDRLIDWMYSVTDWLDISAPPPSRTAPAAESESAEMEDADNQEARAAEGDPFLAPGGFQDQAWVGAVAALALYHGATQRRRAQPRAGGQNSVAAGFSLRQPHAS